MRAAPPPKAIALSGIPAIMAADPRDPTSPARFKNSRRCVKFVVIFPPLVSGLSARPVIRSPPDLPAGAFRNLDPAPPALQLRSLIIVALGSECELQKAVATLPANIICSDAVGRGLRIEDGRRNNDAIR